MLGGLINNDLMYKDSKIEVITSFYLPKDNNRKQELLTCLNNNLKQPFINKIHLFLDNEECIEELREKFTDNENRDKIQVCSIGKQPLYSDLFMYCNKLPNKICMITNSDIWLKTITRPGILGYLKSNEKKCVFALTRHEHDLTSPLIDDYEGSHDSFIFIAPIDRKLLKHINHKQNIWGSENVLMYELKRCEYKLYNPCKQIIIVHEHESEIRDEDRKRINTGDYDGDGNYLVRHAMVYPKNL